jgi:hypothetical protein
MIPLFELQQGSTTFNYMSKWNLRKATDNDSPPFTKSSHPIHGLYPQAAGYANWIHTMVNVSSAFEFSKRSEWPLVLEVNMISK